MSLEKLKAAHKVIGAKQTLKALKNGELKEIFIAKNSDLKVVQQIIDEIKNSNVKINKDYTLEELGQICNLKVKVASIGVLK